MGNPTRRHIVVCVITKRGGGGDLRTYGGRRGIYRRLYHFGMVYCHYSRRLAACCRGAQNTICTVLYALLLVCMEGVSIRGVHISSQHSSESSNIYDLLRKWARDPCFRYTCIYI